MLRSRKWIALLIATIFLLICALAGCSNGDKPRDEPTSSKESSSQKNAEPPTTTVKTPAYEQHTAKAKEVLSAYLKKQGTTEEYKMRHATDYTILDVYGFLFTFIPQKSFVAGSMDGEVDVFVSEDGAQSYIYDETIRAKEEEKEAETFEKVMLWEGDYKRDSSQDGIKGTLSVAVTSEGIVLDFRPEAGSTLTITETPTADDIYTIVSKSSDVTFTMNLNDIVINVKAFPSANYKSVVGNYKKTTEALG